MVHWDETTKCYLKQLKAPTQYFVLYILRKLSYISLYFKSSRKLFPNSTPYYRAAQCIVCITSCWKKLVKVVADSTSYCKVCTKILPSIISFYKGCTQYFPELLPIINL